MKGRLYILRYTDTETIDGGNTPDEREYPEILSNVNKRDFTEFKTEVGDELTQLESKTFNGYTMEKNYTDNIGLIARWYPPHYETPTDNLMCVSFEVPVTGGTTIKHLLGWHKTGGDVNTIIELDENHNIIDPVSRSKLQTDDVEVTATLRPNTKYLLIPCLKSLKSTAYVKDSNGNVIWRMLGGDVIKGLLALNETTVIKTVSVNIGDFELDEYETHAEVIDNVKVQSIPNGKIYGCLSFCDYGSYNDIAYGINVYFDGINNAYCYSLSNLKDNSLSLEDVVITILYTD